MTPFEECGRRIDRAHTHCAAFVAGWRTLLESDSYFFLPEMKDERTGIVSATLKNSIRHELSLELGEFFYQLRSALDGAVYRAVDLRRGTKNIARIDRLDFPITKSVTAFEKAALHENPFPEDLRKWIEGVQPYFTGKTPEQKEISFFLLLLHDCARKDRHRQLHLVAVVPDKLEGTIQVQSPCVVDYVRAKSNNLLEDKCEFLEFGVSNTFPDMDIELNGKFTIQVSIEEIPGVVNDMVVQTLLRIEAATKLVVKRFEKAFE